MSALAPNEVVVRSTAPLITLGMPALLWMTVFLCAVASSLHIAVLVALFLGFARAAFNGYRRRTLPMFELRLGPRRFEARFGWPPDPEGPPMVAVTLEDIVRVSRSSLSDSSDDYIFLLKNGTQHSVASDYLGEPAGDLVSYLVAMLSPQQIDLALSDERMASLKEHWQRLRANLAEELNWNEELTDVD